MVQARNDDDDDSDDNISRVIAVLPLYKVYLV